jgi:hypothetical protein
VVRLALSVQLLDVVEILELFLFDTSSEAIVVICRCTQNCILIVSPLYPQSQTAAFPYRLWRICGYYCVTNNPLTFCRDLLQHRLALIEDLAVGKANDRVAQFVQVRRAGLIVFDLLGVGIAIDFDAEFGFIAIEVDDDYLLDTSKLLN